MLILKIVRLESSEVETDYLMTDGRKIVQTDGQKAVQTDGRTENRSDRRTKNRTNRRKQFIKYRYLVRYLSNKK